MVSPRLINSVVLSSFLASTLLTNLPLNEQTPSTQEIQKLKEEIRVRADKIRKTVKTLEAIEKIAPIVMATAGTLLTIAAAAVTAVLFWAPWLNLKRLSTLVDKLASKKIRYQKGRKYLWSKMKKYLLLSPKLRKDIKELRPKSIGGEKGVIEWAKKIQHKFASEDDILQKAKRIAKVGAPIGAIVVALIGIPGTLAASIGASYLFPAALASAYDGAQKLKDLEKEYPGILTPQQKKLLKKFDTISQDLTVQAGIKGAKIQQARKSIVNAALQQHLKLVATFGGPQEARKVFSKYITLKWRENIFQKVAGTAAGIMVKIPLKATTKKIEKLETQHPLLKAALERSAQAYTTQVNELLEELKNQIVEAAEKGKLKPGEILQPIIAL